MPAEPEPFDLCASSSLSGLICARVRIFHSECQRELAMASSEPNTSRLPEEDSSDMDSDSDNEVSQINIDSQISTSIRSSKSAKSDGVSIVDSMQRHSHMDHNFEKGIFFCLLYEVLL